MCHALLQELKSGPMTHGSNTLVTHQIALQMNFSLIEKIPRHFTNTDVDDDVKLQIQGIIENQVLVFQILGK